MKHFRLAGIASLIPLLLVLSSCGRKNEEGTATRDNTQQTPEASVTEVDMGRRINSAHQVEEKTDTFAPIDTLWASVRTENTPAGTRLLARWVYTEGDAEQIITEETHTTEQAGTGYTSFFAFNPDAWPVGSYELRIGVDGDIKKVKEFHVSS